jgi:heterodisulfide reductase subunit A
LNIEVITYADLISVEGEVGSFKVRVKKKARSVDAERCTGCGTCMENCPVINQPYSSQDSGNK